MAKSKVDTGGETIKEEIREHKALMKHSPTFRKAMGTMPAKSKAKAKGKGKK